MSIMAQWELKENGKVVPCQSLQCFPPAESALSNKVEVAKFATLNASITAILGDSVSIPNGPLSDQVEDPYDLEPYGDDEDDSFLMPEADFVDAADKTILQQSFTDTLININVLLPKGEGDALTKVMRRYRLVWATLKTITSSDILDL